MSGALPTAMEPRDKPTVGLSPSSPMTNSTPLETPTIGYADSPQPKANSVKGQIFGDYELLEEVGRGGMGVVYKARQKTLDRIVALKMILSGPISKPEDLQRFRIEAEATARLKHPNIVTVHGVGEIDGQHYYSMDYIEGQSLAQRLSAGPMSSRTAARYTLTIARALHHAHTQGILHRDIKPSNILLDTEDQPHVTDFGLAKKLDGDSGQTRTGVIMGTPSYMAPEQASGKTKELGPASDVYSIGAVLYELVTGRPPFRSETPLDTLKHVLEEEPAPPRLLNPNIDRDLETICLKCLEKDSRHRYGDAEQLAADLNRYLNGDTISARSFNMIDRLTRTLDRSQLDVEFGSWGTLLLFFAAIVFVGHLLTFILIQVKMPEPFHWTARFGQFGILGVVLWHYRSSSLLPKTGAERQLWSIWVGYFLAFAITAAVSRQLATPDHPWNELRLYPFSAVLTGLAFFVMGSNYWGRCYAVGLAFFALAAIMAINLDLAPLEFGALWGVTLLTIGLRLRRVAKSTAGESTLQQ